MRAMTAYALTASLTLGLCATTGSAMADSVDFGRNAPPPVTTQNTNPQAPKPDTNSQNSEIPSPKEAGQEIGEGAATAAKTVGETTKEVTTAIGHGARDTTKAIGHGTRDFFRGIGDGLRKAW